MALFEIEDQYVGQLAGLGVPLADRTADYARARDHEMFVQNASKNPKQRDKLLEMLAEGGTYVPEVERVKQVRGEFNELLNERLKPLDEYLEKQSKREEEARTQSTQSLINDGRGYLREQGWDDSGVEEVEQFMRQNSVGSYKVASDYLKRQKPDPTPLPTTSWNGSNLGSSWFTPPDDAPDHKLLLENPAAYSQREIQKFFREKAAGTLKI